MTEANLMRRLCHFIHPFFTRRSANVPFPLQPYRPLYQNPAVTGWTNVGVIATPITLLSGSSIPIDGERVADNGLQPFRLQDQITEVKIPRSQDKISEQFHARDESLSSIPINVDQFNESMTTNSQTEDISNCSASISRHNCTNVGGTTEEVMPNNETINSEAGTYPDTEKPSSKRTSTIQDDNESIPTSPHVEPTVGNIGHLSSTASSFLLSAPSSDTYPALPYCQPGRDTEVRSDSLLSAMCTGANMDGAEEIMESQLCNRATSLTSDQGICERNANIMDAKSLAPVVVHSVNSPEGDVRNTSGSFETNIADSDSSEQKDSLTLNENSNGEIVASSSQSETATHMPIDVTGSSCDVPAALVPASSALLLDVSSENDMIVDSMRHNEVDTDVRDIGSVEEDTLSSLPVNHSNMISSMSTSSPTFGNDNHLLSGTSGQQQFGVFDTYFVPLSPAFDDEGLFAALPSLRNDGTTVVSIVPLIQSIGRIGHTIRRLHDSGPYIQVLRRGADGRLRTECADPASEFVVVIPTTHPGSSVLIYEDDYALDMGELES